MSAAPATPIQCEAPSIRRSDLLLNCSTFCGNISFPIQGGQAIEALLCRNSFFTTCLAPLLPAEHWSMLFGLPYRRTSPCACVRPSSLHAYALSRRLLTGLSIFENERELRMKNGLNSLIINEVRNSHDDHSGTRIAPLISVCPSHARTRSNGLEICCKLAMGNTSHLSMIC